MKGSRFHPSLAENGSDPLPLKRKSKSPFHFHEEVNQMEKGNEIWLLTLSDLLMLFTVFFTILFGMLLHKQARPSQSLSEQTAVSVKSEEDRRIEGATLAPGVDSEKVTASLESSLLALFKEEKEENGMNIERQDQHLVLTFPEKIVFDPGQAHLKSSSQPILSKVASFVLEHPQLLVEVQGHTDDRPINNLHYPSNWELSADRATQVAKALIHLGLTPAQLSVKGFGEYRALYPNDSDTGRLKNRRVEIQISLPPQS
jgi:chemotaxis protein MotB